jgi:transaldolase
LPTRAKTIAEARALSRLVDRPNVRQDPGDKGGRATITACLAEGININVTLIFSLQRYEEVIDAFMAGA